MISGRSSNLWRPMEAQGFRQKYGHLSSRDRRVGAEVSTAATGCDPRCRERFDVLEEEVSRRNIGESRGARGRTDLQFVINADGPERHGTCHIALVVHLKEIRVRTIVHGDWA